MMHPVLKLFGAAVCRFRGHMRRYRVYDQQTDANGEHHAVPTDKMRCPRCRQDIVRKITAKRLRAAT